MSLPAHPYWLSMPTIFMGYLTGSDKYTGNAVNKSTIYSFLGTSTFLYSWRNFNIYMTETTIPRLRPAIIGSTISGAFMIGSIYCMGHLIGVAANKQKYKLSPTFKNLIEGPTL